MKKLLKFLLIVLALGCFFWTFLANLPILGAWFPILYLTFAALTVIVGIASALGKIALRIFLLLLMVPILFAGLTVLWWLFLLVKTWVVALFALLFSH